MPMPILRAASNSENAPSGNNRNASQTLHEGEVCNEKWQLWALWVRSSHQPMKRRLVRQSSTT